MQMKRLFSLVCLVLFALFATTASGLGESEYTLVKEFHTLTPIYMPGHASDPQWIEGFSFSGDIYLQGALIGTVTGQARLWNPPMRVGETYDHLYMLITNDIDGLGTFEVRAQAVTLGSSTSATAGDYLLSWSGPVTNGSGYFDGFYGLSAGSGFSNLFTGTASATEILTLRAGF
jgi:hypothetical protein